jgi:mannose-6-phosphate isomerase
MYLLDNTVQPYPWGQPGGIDRLVGRPPGDGPQAELWVGTHHRGPSVVASGPAAGRTLGDVLGRELPFLLKVLAIAEPLSLQAHPSADQAAQGYAREEAAGVAPDAPHRTYHDPNPKPEVLVALERTYALCGFRTTADAHRRIAELGVGALAPLLEHLASSPDPAVALAGALGWLVRLDGQERAEVAAGVARASAPLAAESPTRPGHWVARLAAGHPGDPLCVAPLLLELVVLDPGQAIRLPAGNLHAYLSGAGVEVMASSDNVLRGGLTAKHVDGEELLVVVCFAPGVPDRPTARTVGAITTYDTGEAFSLGCVRPGLSDADVAIDAATLVLPLGAEAQVAREGESLVISPGQAVYVEPGAPVRVASRAPVWWATVAEGPSRVA